MLNLKEELFQVTDLLNKMGVEYAVCGGLAVLIHGCPRPTYDLDFIVKSNNLARIRSHLKHLGYKIQTDVMTFQADQPNEIKVWRISKARDEDLLSVDFLLINPFLEDVWAGRRQFEFDGKSITVVGLDGLRKMKESAGRPKDLIDLENLKELEDGNG